MWLFSARFWAERQRFAVPAIERNAAPADVKYVTGLHRAGGPIERNSAPGQIGDHAADDLQVFAVSDNDSVRMAVLEVQSQQFDMLRPIDLDQWFGQSRQHDLRRSEITDRVEIEPLMRTIQIPFPRCVQFLQRIDRKEPALGRAHVPALIP